MFIYYLKKYQPVNTLILIAVGVIVWIKPLTDSSIAGIYFDPDPMPAYNLIFNLIGSPKFSFLCRFIAFALILMQAIVINGILNQYNLMGFRSYLPGILFLLICSNFPEYQILHPVLFANLFLLFAWERVIRTSDKENTAGSYYNSAFLIGLATLFYPNYIYFLLIILFSTGINRIGSVREIAMVITGFFTVWYFYIALYYLFMNTVQFSGIGLDFSFSFPKYTKLFLTQKIFLLFLFLLIIMASFQLGTYISNLKIQMRRNLKFLFFWFWTGIFIFLFTKSSTEIVYILAVPISVLLTLFYVNINKKWLREGLWLLFLLTIIINLAFSQSLHL